ncbi:MAG: NUDIX domain-containing protein [Bacteroidales bacterium]
MERIFYENRELRFLSPQDSTAFLPKGHYTYNYLNLADLIEVVHTHFLTSPNGSVWDITFSNPKQTQQTFSDFIHDFEIIKAAGGLVHAINPNTKEVNYLYIYRYKMWDLPKGKREKKEENRETALREVIEETGISNLQLGRALPTTYHFIKGKGCFSVKESSWFEMEAVYDSFLKPQLEEGIEKAVWLNQKEIFQYREAMFASISYLTACYFSEFG